MLGIAFGDGAKSEPLVVLGAQKPEERDVWRPVTASFDSAAAELTGELVGELRWELYSLVGVGLMTNRFELTVSGEDIELTLAFQRRFRLRPTPGFTANGWIEFHDGSPKRSIAFSKHGIEEGAWMRMGGPHRLRP